MAKLGFKDIIMKYLKKDEAFKLKYVDPLNKKNFHISYRSKGEAEAKMAQLKKDGVKDIQITQEDAPANATGTAVAGTGDDSSTVVVKKKKELQKKLMTRMGITESIDRAIPDLEYPKDEIRERVDQLKQFALGETPEGFALVTKAKEIAKKMSGDMNGAVKEIEKLQKGLSNNSSVKDALQKANEGLNEKITVLYDKDYNYKRQTKVFSNKKDAEKFVNDIKQKGGKAVIVSEDLDAQPQDKDVKKVKGTQPKKYYKTLDKDTKKKRAAFFKKKGGTYKKSDDDDDYKAAPGDEKAKTKPSTFTKKFKKMYGDSYGYTAMHMKPVAKLNPLRRKDEGR